MMMQQSPEDRNRLIALARLAVKNFNGGDWQELGVHTDCLDIITGHDRLLRSLSFGDNDYSGNAHAVIMQIAERSPQNIDVIEQFIAERYGYPEPLASLEIKRKPDATPAFASFAWPTARPTSAAPSVKENVSTAPSRNRQLVFSPAVFEVPEGGVEQDLVAVMSPFAREFEPVFGVITVAANEHKYRCLRAKDIWEHSTVIQDVFSLIFRAKIVVCDFTGKNPNVFYEAGIAHTLGKHVIPITQNAEDIPFDLRHHRYLTYMSNNEGLEQLSRDLAKRIGSLR